MRRHAALGPPSRSGSLLKADFPANDLDDVAADPDFIAVLAQMNAAGALQRAGRVHLRKDGDEVWVGGDVVEVIRGEIGL